jgi:hypothetical protein
LEDRERFERLINSLGTSDPTPRTRKDQLDVILNAGLTAYAERACLQTLNDHLVAKQREQRVRKRTKGYSQARMLQLGALLEEKKAKEEKEKEALNVKIEKEAKKATASFIKMVWKEFPVNTDLFSWDAKIGSYAKATARAITDSSFPATPRPGKKIVVGMPGRKKITGFTTLARPRKSSRYGWGVFIKAVWKDLPISYDIFTYEIGS